jgi:hypothetical protein
MGAMEMETPVKPCACGCGNPARRKWYSESCRQRSRTDAAAVANRAGRRLDGELRPSRKSHNAGRRSDGSKRPSRLAHEEKHDGRRKERRGPHTTLERLERPFHAIDGEGATTNGEHEYLLLGSGKRLVTAERRPLDFPLCMSILAGTIPSGVEPVVFGLDYDVTMWVRSLARSVLEELMDRQGRADPDRPWRVRYVKAHGFEFDWLPGHFFALRSPSGRHIRISEVRKFFGRSFVEALESQGITPPPWMAEMKESRSKFTRRQVLYDPAVAFYNSEERRHLEILMTVFRERCITAGVVPAKWNGPGQGANVLLREWAIKDYLSGAGAVT